MAERAMLERFIEQYADRAYAFAYHLCGREEEARELVQEAFCKLIRKWDRYDPAQPFEAWFLTVLRNAYYDQLRRRDRRAEISLDAAADGDAEGSPLGETLADGVEAVAEQVERGWRAETVHQALQELSPKHRALLTMVDLEGLRYEDAAAALDCPLNTVRSGVFRAREALRKILVARMGSEVSHELP